MKYKCLILMFLIADVAFCPAQDTSFSEKYFKLIKTYSSLDEVCQIHPELKAKPPHIEIENNEVLFYDDNMELENKMLVVSKEKIGKDDPKYGVYSDNINIYKNYKIIDGELLGIWESYGIWDGCHTIPKSARVYNNKGEFITSINSSHHIEFAPDKEHFATNYIGEVGGDTVFIYDLDGNKYSSIYCESPDCNIKFSNNSKYVLIYDYTINKVYIVNLMGEKEFIYTIENGNLFDFFVSPNCQKILISLFFPSDTYSSLLLDKRKKIIWEKPIARIKDCVFLENDELLLSVLEKSGMSVSRIDQRGNIIGEVICDKVIKINNSYFIVKIGDKYYEYEV